MIGLDPKEVGCKGIPTLGRGNGILELMGKQRRPGEGSERVGCLCARFAGRRRLARLDETGELASQAQRLAIIAGFFKRIGLLRQGGNIIRLALAGDLLRRHGPRDAAERQADRYDNQRNP